ncbi:twin-arginine translocation signal domain-containing protein [Nostocoides sp.]|uniref:twin-arginine translocation signal domain-containing protein n=1 Tax=Nostocoides sp. TaxID=1917966 RepID=UPI003BB02016
MSGASRRGFIAALGAGAATVAVAPFAEAAEASYAVSEVSPGVGTAVVAYIADPASGSLVLWVGEDEIEITDRSLVARLVAAARR